MCYHFANVTVSKTQSKTLLRKGKSEVLTVSSISQFFSFSKLWNNLLCLLILFWAILFATAAFIVALLFCRDAIGVSILLKCKLIRPKSCAVASLRRQLPSSSVTNIVATVIRWRDSSIVWNFSLILTVSAELNGLALMCVFFRVYITQCFEYIQVRDIDCWANIYGKEYFMVIDL